ncbi:MAG: phosphoribosylaminoimidazole-succinocarboxamide synthase [Actinomycetota bacterium]|nr:phosphoribosylaminoimidazole-succinocarboxamide synthase [Actinomycetota bacterium]
MELMHSGKVREVYRDGNDLILVASDRISVFDMVLPTPVPDKGALLTQLSVWWFDRLGEVVPHHVISATDVPDRWRGRALRCRRLNMVPVECVVRGHLTGSGLREYRATGSVCGVRLPEGLQEASELPEPIFTPTTKADPTSCAHDEPLTFDQVVDVLGRQEAEEVRRITLEVFRRGSRIAAERGILIADTKLEFGRDDEGVLRLADEVLTSDSSRFWSAAGWRPGVQQPSFDKQLVRDWVAASGPLDPASPPELPEDVVQAVRARYVEAYEILTGLPWRSPEGSSGKDRKHHRGPKPPGPVAPKNAGPVGTP